MLSFLREQNNGAMPGQEPPTPAGQPPTEGAAPLVDQEFLTVAARGKRARKSTTILAILFVAGLVCLGFMITKTAPEAASAATSQSEESRVEAALGRLTGIKSELFGKMDEIVQKFYEFSGVMQVEVNELAKDPFTLDLFPADLKQEPLVLESEQTDLASIWRQQTRNMRLLSIMCSDQGKSCMIGSKILREGDSIRDFTVRQIGDSFVKLQWSGERSAGTTGAPPEAMEIVLKLSE